tara:strand:+ start:4126 stop:5586 length:1461 start_codon:yes stop_codon:yes gene_type:complete
MSNLDNTIKQIIKDNDIPHEWNPLIAKELKELNPEKNIIRKNLTAIPFITIDGEDAKDFDDAIYCQQNNSNFILQVAIADVASIVSPNSEIDKEAFKRGASIYFPKKVIPMLPEIISNNLCSLVPNKERGVIICEIIFDLSGEIKSYKFYEALIISFKRFTYNEIQDFRNDGSKISNSLESLKKLTDKLLQNKFKRNALEIESTEPTLDIDNEGNIIDINIPKRLFAHQMIEESMIAANICAAKFIKKHYGFGIYRVHEEPESIKIEGLKKFFSLRGHLSKSHESTLGIINSFIKHANKNEDNKLLNILILQSLKRAQYSSKELGHFGLQLKQYSHFTSPIRRYPDLLVHRMIKNILNKSNYDFIQKGIEEDLGSLSSLEKRSEIISRQVNQQLICYHLIKFIGQSFSSFVVGITDFGLFCEIDKYYISGLLHVSDLKRDRYIFDSQANILKGKRTGEVFRIGQKIKVQLVNVIPEERKIILIPQK